MKMFDAEFLEKKVDYLIKNNLKWGVSRKFPVIVLDKFDEIENGVAAIELYKYSTQMPEEVIIKDLRTGKVFASEKFPKALWVVSTVPNDELLTQLLLHELNHWYSHELVNQESHWKEMEMQEHGTEFKKYGRLIGLDARFNRANAKADLNKKTIHVGICDICGKECAITSNEKDMNELVRYTWSKCCHGDIKYGGTRQVDKNVFENIDFVKI